MKLSTFWHILNHLPAATIRIITYAIVPLGFSKY